ncbi:MAG: MFS transporter [Fibrobacterales bacterium]
MVSEESDQPHLKIILTALLMTLLLASLDNTIVATALGAIVADLGEIEKFTWVTSFYMIAGMPSMLIFGKLSDMYGRKRFFLTGLGVFLVSSVLCGTADSMVELSLYRALQGVGGGALLPISFTIIFDCYPPEKRGKIMALFGVVFGISSLIGPIIGAYLPQHVGWEWIFYINLPIGIIGGGLLIVFYNESHEHQKQKIDWLGVLFVVLTISSVMTLLLFGGSVFAWFSLESYVLTGAFFVFATLLWLIENRADSPVIPIHLFSSHLFTGSQLASFFYGMLFIALLIYTPLFLQGALLLPLSSAGMVLMPMMLGVVVGAQIAGQILNHYSFRNILLCSIGLVLGTLLITPWALESHSHSLIMAFMAFFGAAVGANFSTLNISATHGVAYSSRGSANSSVIFFRQMGMAIGVTIYGLIFNEVLFEGLAVIDSLSIAQDQVHTLLTETIRAELSSEVLQQMSSAFNEAILLIFKVLFVPAIGALAAIIYMGNARNLD